MYPIKTFMLMATLRAHLLCFVILIDVLCVPTLLFVNATEYFSQKILEGILLFQSR